MSCVRPLTLADRIVSCNNCYECKLKRVNGWVLRLQEQQKVSTSAYFITLTYEDEKNNPDSNTAFITKSGRRTLVKRDLQLYFKRLRKLSEKHGGNSIKYYAVGEYGARSYRPHYHAIIFNAQKDLLKTAWIHGFVHIGSVTSNSIAYCLKYITKGRTVPVNNDDDRAKEFSVMSKRLGASYLSDSAIRYHQQDPINRGCATRDGGYKFPLPRYLKERIFTTDQKTQIAVHYEKKYIDEIYEKFKNFTHADWQVFKKEQKEVAIHTFKIMKYLSKQNLKL